MSTNVNGLAPTITAASPTVTTDHAVRATRKATRLKVASESEIGVLYALAGAFISFCALDVLVKSISIKLRGDSWIGTIKCRIVCDAASMPIQPDDARAIARSHCASIHAVKIGNALAVRYMGCWSDVEDLALVVYSEEPSYVERKLAEKDEDGYESLGYVLQSYNTVHVAELWRDNSELLVRIVESLCDHRSFRGCNIEPIAAQVRQSILPRMDSTPTPTFSPKEHEASGTLDTFPDSPEREVASQRALRIAAYAVVARVLGLPIHRLNADATLKDVIDERASRFTPIAEVMGEMATWDGQTDLHNLVPGMRTMSNALMNLDDQGRDQLVGNAYMLMSQHHLAISSLACQLVSDNLRLKGQRADIAVDAIMSTAMNVDTMLTGQANDSNEFPPLSDEIKEHFEHGPFEFTN